MYIPWGMLVNLYFIIMKYNIYSVEFLAAECSHFGIADINSFIVHNIVNLVPKEAVIDQDVWQSI